MQKLFHKGLTWVRAHKKQLGWASLAVLAGVVLVQIFYPGDKLLPFTKVDGQFLGGLTKADAALRLDAAYAKDTISLRLNDGDRVIHTDKLSDMGIVVKSQASVDSLKYPWYLRIVPSSVLWAGLLQQPAEPAYETDKKKLDAYITQRFGKDCRVEPTNATLEYKSNELKVVPAKDGGTCQRQQMEKTLEGVRISLLQNDSAVVPVKPIKPVISDDTAKKFKTELSARLKNGVAVKAGNETQTIPKNDVLSWLIFKNDTDQLDIMFDEAKAAPYFTQNVTPKVAKPAGVSKVTTHDFVETSRINGPNGQTLNLSGTLGELRNYLLKKTDIVAAQTTVVSPKVEYTRTYSPTDAGLSALVKHYAEDHPGTFGISFIELSGKHRRAEFQQDKVFTTASTYKLFVAYSALKRVEAGSWRWSDSVQGGRNLDQCFDDMIVRSDNACAEAMLQKIGFREITSEIQALGLKNSTFLKGDSPQTTAGDLSTFLAILNSGQMLNQQTSRDKLLSALKRNIYRQGIPAGASGQVADKVGFLNGLFHDAAIVYSPSGTYVLTIMSDGSNWATIADLTRKIEALRAQ